MNAHVYAFVAVATIGSIAAVAVVTARNVVHAAYILGGDLITPDCLPPELHGRVPESRPLAPARSPPRTRCRT